MLFGVGIWDDTVPLTMLCCVAPGVTCCCCCCCDVAPGCCWIGTKVPQLAAGTAENGTSNMGLVVGFDVDVVGCRLVVGCCCTAGVTIGWTVGVRIGCAVGNDATAAIGACIGNVTVFELHLQLFKSICGWDCECCGKFVLLVLGAPCNATADTR